LHSSATEKSFRILALSGSLRAKSSNTSLLQAMASLAPSHISIMLYAGLDKLPYFNPDLDNDVALPPIVRDFRALIGQMDAVVICSPEYAHGIPGVLKNALDWLVGSLEFPNKIVANINASTRSHYAYDALNEVLKTMSAQIVPEASLTIPIANNRVTEAEMVVDPTISTLLTSVIVHLVRARQETLEA
jgi:chromate reductase, NAD(P)H dehydrogenase (quinone)